MASALPRASSRHWVYVDAQRTHEVHAQVVMSGSEGQFVTTEFPMGSREPGEMLRIQSPVHGEDELVSLLTDLEGRLALGGAYFRTEEGASEWAPLNAAPPAVDLRAHEAPIPGLEATGGRMRFHHFHGEKAAQDRLLISMPRPGMSGRHVLAELAFEFPRVDQGDLNVLHPRLAAPLLASAVAREHVEAPRKGFAKLFEARDYERAYGEGWLERTRSMLGRAAARLVGGPAPAPAPLAPPPVEAPAAGPPAELEQMRASLASQRIEALKIRFVDPVTEAQLVGTGEHAIRRFVGLLRRRSSHEQAYELSILEAALLTQYAIPGHMWDLVRDEGAKLIRYVYGYR